MWCALDALQKVHPDVQQSAQILWPLHHFAQFAVVMPDDSAVTQWSGTSELVVANILAGPLVTLAPTLLSLLAPGGQLLLAGLLKDQASEVIDAYANQVPLQIAAQEDGWVLLSGQRAA